MNKAAGWANVNGDVVFFYKLAPDNGIRMTGFVDGSIPVLSLDIWRWCECLRCSKIDITEFGIPKCGCYSDEEFEMMSVRRGIDIDFSQTSTIIQAFSIAKKFNFKSGIRAKKLPRRASLL